jgi:hypothetical protein
LYRSDGHVFILHPVALVLKAGKNFPQKKKKKEQDAMI